MEPTRDPWSHLAASLASGRIHSAYLFSGSEPAPRQTALHFARALACQGDAASAPCESCDGCRRSGPREEILLDGTGKKGPLLRHVGDHPDLFWIERGADDTRVRIGQVRALQQSLRLRTSEGGRRCAVIADAEWLNQEAQNALLRTLEEPPPDTTLVLVTTSPAGLLATVRSRCQRVVFAPPVAGDASDDEHDLLTRLERIAGCELPAVLDWAEEFRGARAPAAAGLNELLRVASSWLHRRATDGVLAGSQDPQAALRAFGVLQQCRKSLAQRNANPQMMAERALLALRDAGAAS